MFSMFSLLNLPLLGALAPDRHQKRRETARKKATTLLWDGYRFAMNEQEPELSDFLRDRVSELGPSDEIVGWVDVIHPAPASPLQRVEQDYFIACLRNDETGEWRFVCSCWAWREEWAASKEAAPRGACVCAWCKHTLAFEMTICVAASVQPMVAWVNYPTAGQRERERDRRQRQEQSTRERNGYRTERIGFVPIRQVGLTRQDTGDGCSTCFPGWIAAIGGAK